MIMRWSNPQIATSWTVSPRPRDAARAPEAEKAAFLAAHAWPYHLGHRSYRAYLRSLFATKRLYDASPEAEDRS